MLRDFSAMLYEFAEKYFFTSNMPRFSQVDFVEIIIISFLIYNLMVWIKDTRAWMLFKGIAVIVIFCLLAAIFQMNTILWIVGQLVNAAIIAVVIVFQPELRRALEQLGRKKFLASIFSFDTQKSQERYTERTINEIVKATYEMAKVKTGALIVIEQEIVLTEYERTGIMLDSIVSSQLLVNIFEHNTPLHDGAIIVRGDRVVSATCYLPLSDSMGLSKELGTRHRAAVGVSEVSDALVIVVSEENGNVSVAQGGKLFRNLDVENLKKKIGFEQKQPYETNRFEFLKRRLKNVQKNHKASDK